MALLLLSTAEGQRGIRCEVVAERRGALQVETALAAKLQAYGFAGCHCAGLILAIRLIRDGQGVCIDPLPLLDASSAEHFLVHTAQAGVQAPLLATLQ